jgi:hypothetical protein
MRIFVTDVLQICRADGAGFADGSPANPGAQIFQADGGRFSFSRLSRRDQM